MTVTESSLIPFNTTNKKLIDDNFSSINDNNYPNLIEDQSNTDNINDKTTNEVIESFNNENSIENFSNNNSCPLTYRTNICLAYTSQNYHTGNCGKYGCRVAYLGNLNYPYLYFGHGGNHPHEFQIISPGHRKAGSPVYYGDYVYIYNRNMNTYLNTSSNSSSNPWVYRVSYYSGRRWRYRAYTRFYILPDPSSGKRKGDIVHYNDRIVINCDGNINGKNLMMHNSNKIARWNYGIKSMFYIRRPSSFRCKVQVPRMIDNGNFRIKKITIRCDDQFEMYISNKKYVGSNWARTYVFKNIPINNPGGYNIALRCYNGGGPGALIACIELSNGSIIYTDETWDCADKVSNERLFLTNPNNYPYGSEWNKPQVIGYNQYGKQLWNGRRRSDWDNRRYFIDKNFSPFAKWICGSNTYRKGYTYFKKTIGKPPSTQRCRHNLTFGQALCYLDANPDVKQDILSRIGPFKYEINYNKMTWHEHEAEARKRGGHLASITSRDELNELAQFWSRRNIWWGLWIGGKRTAHTHHRDGSGYSWGWTDGSSWKFSNWHRGEPNNIREKHTQIYRNGLWNDLPGYYKLAGLYKYYDKTKTYDINKAVEEANNHWKSYGCTVRENRNYNCSKPPDNVGNYSYKGCHGDDYNKRVIPNFRGDVVSLADCAAYAEKNKETVFGLTDGSKCYTGSDIKQATKNKISPGCSILGRKHAFQVYNRKFPFPPKNPKMNQNNFQDKPEKYENYENKNNSSTNIYIIVLIIILILILYYFY